MDKAKATPKDFFMWAGAMLALYGSVIAFIALVFDYINYAFPDTALNYWVDPYQGGVAYEMASLIVLAPTFLILMRLIRRAIEADASRAEVWVRRWGLFLTVFLAAATFVIDLIVLLTSFLQGEELSMRFLLKVLIVLLVSAAGFMHFLADLWGYWQKFPGYARYINWSTGALVILTVAAGFLIIGSPQSQRQMRIDAQRVSDLQQIQSQVLSYWQAKESLPENLSDLEDPFSGWTIPTDPVTKAPYTYHRYSPLDFGLCATFSQPGNAQDTYYAPVAVSDNWQHGAGPTCFDRTIDPQRYPPYPKSVIQ